MTQLLLHEQPRHMTYSTPSPDGSLKALGVRKRRVEVRCPKCGTNNELAQADGVCMACTIKADKLRRERLARHREANVVVRRVYEFCR